MRVLTEQDYLANRGLIQKVARGCYARCQAVGLALDYEDVVQELSLTFVKAWRQFDPSRGFQFSTYYVMAARHQFNRFIDKLMEERVEHGVRSVEEISSWCSDDGEALSMAEVIASDELGPEARAMLAQRMEQLQKRLKPLTQVVLQWLVKPPLELSVELAAVAAHANVGREQGRTIRPRVEVTAQTILAFLQLLDPEHITRGKVQETRRELDLLLKELEAA